MDGPKEINWAKEPTYIIELPKLALQLIYNLLLDWKDGVSCTEHTEDRDLVVPHSVHELLLQTKEKDLYRYAPKVNKVITPDDEEEGTLFASTEFWVPQD